MKKLFSKFLFSGTLLFAIISLLACSNGAVPSIPSVKGSLDASQCKQGVYYYSFQDGSSFVFTESKKSDSEDVNSETSSDEKKDESTEESKTEESENAESREADSEKISGTWVYNDGTISNKYSGTYSGDPAIAGKLVLEIEKSEGYPVTNKTKFDFTISEDKSCSTVVPTVTYKTITITFDANGGEGTMEKMTIPATKEVDISNCTFVKDELPFAGWITKNDDGEETPVSNMETYSTDKDVTLYATYAKKVKVTFCSPSDSGLKTADGEKKYTIEYPANKPFKLPESKFITEEQDNYVEEITGWKKYNNFNPEDTYKIGDEFTPTEDCELYITTVVYEIYKFYSTNEKNEQFLIKKVRVLSNEEKLEDPFIGKDDELPVEPGKTFVGWIHFDYNEKYYLEKCDKQKNELGIISFPLTDNFRSYRPLFLYELTFDPNGGKIFSESKRDYITEERPYYIKDLETLNKSYLVKPEKENCRFQGWFDEEGKNLTEYTELTTGIKFTAKWEEIIHVTQIEFESPTATVKEGRSITLPIKYSPENAEITDTPFVYESENTEIVKVNYKSELSNKEGVEIIGNKEGTTNIVVYLKENPEVKASCEVTVLEAEWNVTFEVDGVEIPPQVIKGSEKATQPEDPVMNGKIFGGWNWDFDNSVTKDIVIQGYWLINPVLVTFDTDGGNEMKPIKVEKDKITYSIKNPTKYAHIFTGWINAADNTSFNPKTTEITEDLTLKATWEKGGGYENPYFANTIYVGAIDLDEAPYSNTINLNGSKVSFTDRNATWRTLSSNSIAKATIDRSSTVPATLNKYLKYSEIDKPETLLGNTKDLSTEELIIYDTIKLTSVSGDVTTSEKDSCIILGINEYGILILRRNQTFVNQVRYTMLLTTQGLERVNKGYISMKFDTVFPSSSEISNFTKTVIEKYSSN